MPADANEYFFREYIQHGIFSAKDLAAGSHCMTPKFLKDQLGRSLKNLGVECVDVYYLHNPETQLTEIPKPEFLQRVREAFEFLESAVEAGEIRYYGVATWNGFRQDPRAQDAMQLAEIAQIAQELAGGLHHFRFVQLPFNLGMPEALTLGNQMLRERERTLAEAAGDLDIAVVASASLLQGQLARNLPGFVAEAFGLENDAQRALQFARSAPGITTALVGMSRVEHAKVDARLVGVAPATVEEFSKLFSRGEGV
jgi:aryl-alcohol dehydrogenase-like predicted oxidoreductase